MVKFDNGYVFDTPTARRHCSTCSTGERELVVYQFMDHGPDEFCPGCTHFTNNVADLRDAGGFRRHLGDGVQHAARPDRGVQGARRAGRCRSSRHTARPSRTTAAQPDGFMLTVFLRDGSDVYRTYTTTARGVDRLLFVNNILDLTPYGRQEDWEDSPPGWPQHPTYG